MHQTMIDEILSAPTKSEELVEKTEEDTYLELAQAWGPGMGGYNNPKVTPERVGYIASMREKYWADEFREDLENAHDWIIANPEKTEKL